MVIFHGFSLCAPFTFPSFFAALYCCANKQRSGVKLKINEPKVVSS